MVNYFPGNPQKGLQKIFAGLTLNKILLFSLAFRIVAAIFSRGYGMYDDHFLVIEVAQGWLDGQNIHQWLPSASPGTVPDVSHNLFYPGTHYIIFLVMQSIGLHDPQIKMFTVRLLHAFYSLSTVYFGYKIVEKLSGPNAAKCASLLLGLLWFMPNLSVRNLVEVACIPPLLGAFWLLIKRDEFDWKNYFAAGFIIGFSFSIRYQSALFVGGVGLTLLIQKNWRGFLICNLGFILNVFLFQCIADIYLWGRPLAEFYGYIQYNIVHRHEYITGYWFNYFLFISGLVIPPFSLFLWFGYFKSYRRSLMLFIPSLLFLAFHSLFENKQERFILPFVPFLIILGTVGLNDAMQNIKVSEKWQKLFWYILSGAIILNMLLLFVFSLASTKTSKMDAMGYLYKQGDSKGYIVESTSTEGWPEFPRYYLGKWYTEYFILKDYAMLPEKGDTVHPKPNYVIFLSDKNLTDRIEKFIRTYPNISFSTQIEPSYIDKLFHKLNPVNKNEPCYIYKINSLNTTP